MQKKRETGITVNGGEIHLQDGDGTEQTVAVVGDDSELGTEETVLHDTSDMGDLNDPNLMGQLNETSNEDFQMGLDNIKQEIKQEIKTEIVTEDDVKTCFGFDDDEDDEEGEDMDFY